MSEKESGKSSENFSLRLGYVLIAVAFLVYVIEFGLAPGPSWLIIPLALFVCAIASFRYYFSAVKKTENQPAKKPGNVSLYLGYGLVAAAFFVFVMGWSFSISIGLFVCGIGSFLYYCSTAKNEK